MVPIPKEYEIPKKNPRGIYPVINYFRCVFCYRCVAVCPTYAYITTNTYELSSPTMITSEELSLSTLKRKTKTSSDG
jgi:NADH-quinone oxidoreductase subunit I